MSKQQEADAKTLSRRKFLTSGAVAGIGGAAAVAGFGVAPAAAHCNEDIAWDVETDVIVIGAGSLV